MLSYLHGYHAGNHADVLKHCVMVALLDHLARKNKPFSYIETHAGAGLYPLDSPEAQKLREHASGIERLWQIQGLPPLVARYVEVVRGCNPTSELTVYPGSPRLAMALLREADPASLFELHPTECARLEQALGARSRTLVRRADGYLDCIGLLPPPSRRGVLLMDPSYELKTDWDAVVNTLVKAQQRFASGIYAIWYPVVQRHRVTRLLERLQTTGIRDMHRFELCVAPDSEAMGMTGSGMVVVNPAFSLPDTLREALPWLQRALGGEGSSCVIERLTAE